MQCYNKYYVNMVNLLIVVPSLVDGNNTVPIAVIREQWGRASIKVDIVWFGLESGPSGRCMALLLDWALAILLNELHCPGKPGPIRPSPRPYIPTYHPRSNLSSYTLRI